MADRLKLSTSGIRLHQFTTGALPILAYLMGWIPPIWAALGLSLLAVASTRLAVLARLWGDRTSPYGKGDPDPNHGLFRLDEATRAVLLGSGVLLLLTGRPVGWLPVLAGATVSLLAGTTAFSFTLPVYVALQAALRRVGIGHRPRPSEEGDCPGNSNCVVCRVLHTAPYARCHWCRLPGIRWCCGLQMSILMVLMLTISFLLNTALEPLVTKLLVTLTILAVVGLSLAVSRQTDDLIGTLTRLGRTRSQAANRCDFLKRLALAESVLAAAEEAVNYAAQSLGAGRVSVMLVEGTVLRIVASRGIPPEVAEKVRVPIPDRICGRVFASGSPVVMNDVGSAALFDTLGLSAGKALASFPLVSAAMQTAVRKIGVINVTDRREGRFSDEDLAELAFIAEAAAIGLSGQMDRRDLERANYDVIRSLMLAIEAKDPYIHGHSQRIRRWATAVGRRLGLRGSRLQALSYAAELHDIGKLAVPDAILKAPRALNPEEQSVIREHPTRGVEMLRHLDFLAPAYRAILYHHERLDGQGYPHGLSGNEVSLEARILAVVDAYDAMTTGRPYRPAAGHEEAATELYRSTGTQFDLRCVEEFLDILSEPAPAVTAAADVAAPVG